LETRVKGAADAVDVMPGACDQGRRMIGRFGTGDLDVVISADDDFDTDPEER
jgi:hypothetical protein